MIALLATILCAAFPVRGSLWRSLDSAFVIDKDTIAVSLEHCLCMCSSSSYRLNASRDTSAKFQLFPGSNSVGFGGITSKFLGMDPSGMMVRCSTSVSISPENSRRFVLHGRTFDWAIWADSIQVNPGSSIFKARWRWSRIDKRIPWVRWIDTLFLGTLEMAPRAKPSLHSQPVLTMLQSVQPDSLAPGWSSCGSGLFLGSDTTATPTWGFSWPYCGSGAKIHNPILPSAPIPVGRTFRAIDAYNSSSTALWRLRLDGKTIDSLWMVGTASAQALPRGSVFPSSGDFRRRGIWAIDPATGRRVPLASPAPVGRQILTTTTGTRVMVVE